MSSVRTARAVGFKYVDFRTLRWRWFFLKVRLDRWLVRHFPCWLGFHNLRLPLGDVWYCEKCKRVVCQKCKRLAGKGGGT